MSRHYIHRGFRSITIFVPVLIALLVGACAPPPPPVATTQEGATSAGGAEQVRLTMTYPGSAAEFEAHQQVVMEALERTAPHIEVEIIHIPPGEYWDKVTTMFAAGTPPDVLFMSEPLRQYATNDSLLALDSYIQADADYNIDDFFPVGLQFFQYDGKQYGIPKDLNVWLTYYNADMFEAAGLKTPMEYFEEGNWTWDTYLELAQQLTQREGDRVTQFGSEYPNIGGWNYSGWVFANGGNVLNEDRTECQVTDPRTVETFQFTADLANVHQVAPSPVVEGGSNISGMTFPTGQVALYVNGTYRILALAESPFNWDVAPMPIGHDDVNPYMTYVHIGGWAIAKNTPYPDEAWQVLRAVTSVDAQTRLTELFGTPPPRRSVFEIYFESELLPSNIAIIPDMLENGRLFPFTPTYAEEQRVYRTYGDLILSQDMTVEEAAAQMCTEVNAILAGN